MMKSIQNTHGSSEENKKQEFKQKYSQKKPLLLANMDFLLLLAYIFPLLMAKLT